MSLISKGSQVVAGANKHLYQLAKAKVPLPSLSNPMMTGVARHGMIKQIVGLNVALYAGYSLMTGPMGLIYKKYFTLDANSSILSLPLCHVGHTSAFSLLINSAALWTLGHWHVTKYGCTHFMTVFGLSCVLATALGAVDVRGHGNQQIAGGMAGTAGLITYNVFANPSWLMVKQINPFIWLSLLTLYGAYGHDKAVVGGVAGGYLAFLLAL